MCIMFYVVMCKKNFILLETYAQALSILIHTGIPMVAIISNKFVITESVITDLKAVPH